MSARRRGGAADNWMRLSTAMVAETGHKTRPRPGSVGKYCDNTSIVPGRRAWPRMTDGMPLASMMLVKVGLPPVNRFHTEASPPPVRRRAGRDGLFVRPI